MARHITWLRMIPLDPTSAPAMISTSLLITNPVMPAAIPEYWLARQRELAELAEGGGEPALVGLTRQQAENMLGGVSRADEE